MKVIREHLLSLDFKEGFIGKLLKDYPAEKIEEKLELLLEKKNIVNPTGWLMTALKNDYQDPEQERYDEEPARGSSNLKCRGTMYRALNETGRINPSPTKNLNPEEQATCLSPKNKKILSRKEALKKIRLIRENLSLSVSSRYSGGREPG